MKSLFPVALAASTIGLSSCANPIYVASLLPGLQQVSDSMNRRAFREWMESDPEPEVRARVAQGDYRLLGLSIQEKDQRWIPGVAGPKDDLERYMATWHVISGYYGDYRQIAEQYMTKFNSLILEARKGVKLDVYGQSSASRNYQP